MDLRTGETPWMAGGRAGAESAADRLVAPTLHGDATCDVAIVGAGITGAMLADLLTSDGLRVIVLDRRRIGAGSTAASTGLLMYEIDTPLLDLAERVGMQHAVAAYHSSLRAVHRLEEIVGGDGLDDDCGFAQRSSLQLASRRAHARRFERECAARRAIGIDVELLSRDEIARLLPSISAPAAMLSHDAAQVDPLRLTRSLLRRAISRGAQVFSETAICRIDHAPQRAVLHTPHGQRISADRVVLATGYESGEFLPRQIGSLHSTYAVCSQPLQPSQRWHGDWLIWESSRPYIYLRTTDDGRAIIGGADVPFKNASARDALLPQRTRMLARRFRKMCPDAPFEPHFAWTGTFGESDDGLPFIGAIDEQPRCLFAMCYGGNGITFGVVAAEIIRNACLGREHAEARLFAFDRGQTNDR
jgi:glycine/D-amino acid oxidase-like deaminating enzyme